MDNGEIKGEIVYSLTNKPMWEYKIFKTDLGFGIYKKLEKDSFISIWFLAGDDKRTLRKDYARTFYHRDDAMAALVTIKMRDGKETD